MRNKLIFYLLIFLSSAKDCFKTGGTIYGYNASDQRNSNVVKNESGAVQNFRGHAVWAGSTDTLLKIKEGIAGQGDNMSYNGSTNPRTASGAWDN